MIVDWENLACLEADARTQWTDPCKPFPFCTFEGVLDISVARQCERDFDTAPFAVGRPQRIMKHDYLKRGGGWDAMSPLQCEVVKALNGPKMINYLEKVTGISGLVADDYLMGGGVHEIMPGGYLNVHTDFNYHPKLKLLRRLNLIVYLNRDWEDAWGGGLELWDEDVRHRLKTISPIINRGALFETNEISFHGHPKPISCPPDRKRRSFAVYYYTTWPKNHVTRSLTNYQLTPWQWARMTSEIADLIEDRIDTLDAVTDALIDRWQTEDIRAAYHSLMGLRTWTLTADRISSETKIDMYILDVHDLDLMKWMSLSGSPNDQLIIHQNEWESKGQDPFFLFDMPQDLRKFSLKFNVPEGAHADAPKFYFDFGEGGSESTARVCPVTDPGPQALRFSCSRPVRALRLDPMSRPGITPSFDVKISY